MCPLANSCASRTSSTSASSRLIISVACWTEIAAPAAPRRTTGQISIAPLTNATAMRKTLSAANFIRVLISGISGLARAAAEHFAHHDDQLQRALVAHRVVDAVGV